MVGRPPRDPEERYWEKVDRSGGPAACWPWTSTVGHNGYGRVKVAGRTYAATRWAYARFIGPIPDGHKVLHTCDNPPCQNPEHWFTGTSLDNVRDMIAKGRQRFLVGEELQSRRTHMKIHRGEEHYAVKLTDAQIAEIRLRWAAGDVLQRELATEYGVRQPYISRLVAGNRRPSTPRPPADRGAS